ncbi:DUF4259 domain-containing protein [Streptomyces sp. NPDC001595]
MRAALDAAVATTGCGPKRPLPDLTALRETAVQALDRVLGEPPEPREPWAESGRDADAWPATLHRIRAALTAAPPAPPARPRA